MKMLLTPGDEMKKMRNLCATKADYCSNFPHSQLNSHEPDQYAGTGMGLMAQLSAIVYWPIN